MRSRTLRTTASAYRVGRAQTFTSSCCSATWQLTFSRMWLRHVALMLSCSRRHWRSSQPKYASNGDVAGRNDTIEDDARLVFDELGPAMSQAGVGRAGVGRADLACPVPQVAVDAAVHRLQVSAASGSVMPNLLRSTSVPS